MRVQRAERILIALVVAFGVCAAIAAVTTIRQVHHVASSVTRPVTRI
jgi:coenzyme F420-reducing hydrogenase gamma subunit